MYLFLARARACENSFHKVRPALELLTSFSNLVRYSSLLYGLLCLDTVFTGVYRSLAASRFLANTQILTLSCSRAISGNADRVIWSMPFSNAHQSVSFHFEICLCSSLGFTAFSSVVHTGTCPLKGAPVKINLKEERP